MFVIEIVEDCCMGVGYLCSNDFVFGYMLEDIFFLLFLGIEGCVCDVVCIMFRFVFVFW